MGTTSHIECTRRKKGPIEKRNTGGYIRGCVCYKWLWWMCCPTPWPLTWALEEPCWHQWPGAGREQSSRFSFGGLILSFFLTLWVPLSFLYSIYLFPLFSSFSSSFQVLSLLKGKSRCSLYTYLFSFRRPLLYIGPCQRWFKSFGGTFPSHVNSWESVLGKYGMTLYAFMSWWEKIIYFVLLQLLISSSRSTSEFLYSLPT